MILKKKNLQTVQGLNKFYIELIAFMYTRNIAIIFDQSRLDLEKKFLFRMKDEHFSFKMKVLASLQLVKQLQKAPVLFRWVNFSWLTLRQDTCKQLQARNYFCIFYSFELKLCRMVELW